MRIRESLAEGQAGGEVQGLEALGMLNVGKKSLPCDQHQDSRLKRVGRAAF